MRNRDPIDRIASEEWQRRGKISDFRPWFAWFAWFVRNLRPCLCLCPSVPEFVMEPDIFRAIDPRKSISRPESNFLFLLVRQVSYFGILGECLKMHKRAGESRVRSKIKQAGEIGCTFEDLGLWPSMRVCVLVCELICQWEKKREEQTNRFRRFLHFLNLSAISSVHMRMRQGYMDIHLDWYAIDATNNSYV